MSTRPPLGDMGVRSHAKDETLRYSTRRTRTHLPVKAAETASQCIDKAALICCVEYMRNSKKASPLISNLEKHKFDARAAVGDTFPGEELWISVSSTSNVDTLSLRPCHLVGYFNNAKWILQASQFERQARQLGVPQPRVTASAAAAVPQGLTGSHKASQGL